MLVPRGTWGDPAAHLRRVGSLKLLDVLQHVIPVPAAVAAGSLPQLGWRDGGDAVQVGPGALEQIPVAIELTRRERLVVPRPDCAQGAEVDHTAAGRHTSDHLARTGRDGDPLTNTLPVPGMSGGLTLTAPSGEARITSLMKSSSRPSRATEEACLRLAAVDRSDPTLLHEQVAIELRRAILDGEAKPGERMPQAKDLAAVLGVNPNTVLRALHLLRDQGLLEVGRGRGIRVAGTPERTEVVERMKELIELGSRSGFRREDLVALLQSLPN